MSTNTKIRNLSPNLRVRIIATEPTKQGNIYVTIHLEKRLTGTKPAIWSDSAEMAVWVNPNE